MAYNGFLLKIGDYEISAKKYIAANTYSAYINMQDVDTYTDADGYVHRNAVDLKALKVEFETPAMLTNKELSDFLANIRRNYIVEKERRVQITAYIPELDDYVTQTGYMADFQPTMYGTYGGVIHYNPIRFAFIGGVYDG